MIVADEQAMVDFGYLLGEVSQGRGLVFLKGNLGAGKTTLCRGILAAFGYNGPVKSPTYTLVEPYDLAGQTIYHFDLYRLSDPEELEFMGIRDYLDGESLCLVEWPEKAGGFLPSADLLVNIQYREGGRELLLESGTEYGKSLKDKMQKILSN